MAKKKKERTPEQKAKLNKKLSRLFFTLLFGACIVIGIIRGVSGISFPKMTDMDAFDKLKNDTYKYSTILVIQGMEDNNVAAATTAQKTNVQNVLSGAGIDYYMDGNIDLDKWETEEPATANYTLSDLQMGIFAREFHSQMNAVQIQVYSGNQYSIKILEYINIGNLASNIEVRNLLPDNGYAWVTTENIIHLEGGEVVIDNSRVVGYNEIGGNERNQSRCDVITSVLNKGETKVSEISFNKFITTVRQLAAKTNTSFRFSGSSIEFSINE
ncbi:MAG: hypothetical protein IK070_03000 [Clostridia bacterium]|nr:hypothetical protein [Clostridia bacterium]